MLQSFCSPRVVSHPLTKTTSFPLNTLEQPRVFHWKDLTLPIQIPHPTKARFKFPTPPKQGSNFLPHPIKAQISHPREGLLCQIFLLPGTEDSQMPVGCSGGC